MEVTLQGKVRQNSDIPCSAEFKVGAREEMNPPTILKMELGVLLELVCYVTHFIKYSTGL